MLSPPRSSCKPGSTPPMKEPDDLPDAEAALAKLAQRLESVVAPNAAFVGIYSGGAWLAERLSQRLPDAHPVGFIDVSYYRDDYALSGLKPNTRRTSLPFDVEGATIVLVDDVLYTGRSVRAAINELLFRASGTHRACRARRSRRTRIADRAHVCRCDDQRCAASFDCVVARSGRDVVARRGTVGRGRVRPAGETTSSRGPKGAARDERGRGRHAVWCFRSVAARRLSVRPAGETTSSRGPKGAAQDERGRDRHVVGVFGWVAARRPSVRPAGETTSSRGPKGAARDERGRGRHAVGRFARSQQGG